MARYARPIADYLATLQAAALLVGVRVALGVLPYRIVEARLRPEPRQRVAVEGPLLSAQHRRVLWAVGGVARRLFGDRPCLPQALVARSLLARLDLPTELRIGVAKKDEGDLLAHAWLEYEGVVLIGGPTSPQQFRPLEPVNRLAA
jgi:hypothetical protein